MSSILNALKRLEAERQPPGGTQPAWLDRDDPWSTKPGGFSSFSHRGAVVWLAAILGLSVMAAAGWFVLHGFPPRAANSGAAAVLPTPVSPAPAIAPQSSRQPPRKPAALRPPYEPAVPPKTAPAPVMPWAENLTRPAAPAAPLPAVLPASSDPSLPPLPAEVGLTLQAVTWSAQAGKRLAVVGGHILRAGDEIDGYRIQEITPDAAILCRSGRCYRLAFRP